jgi:hypothetical protein
MGPIVLLSNPMMQCLTFFWVPHPRRWVGYRVCEGLPETHPQPILGDATWPAAGWGAFPEPAEDLLPSSKISLPRKRWRTEYREEKRLDPTQLAFQAFGDGSAWCRLQEGNGQQQREFFFRPVDDGVQMWMRLTTQIPIEGSYLVQQCLRFTGAQNWSLRRNIAFVPFLSELDLQAMGHPDLTLTYARQGGEWLSFPARQILYATPLGSSLTGHELNGPVDHGLIIRETLDRKVVPASYFRRTAAGETWERVTAGMYWERTALVSNRHSADCVHAVVDLGPLSAGESRTVHGKFYWIEGTKDDLLAAWRRDFPG